MKTHPYKEVKSEIIGNTVSCNTLAMMLNEIGSNASANYAHPDHYFVDFNRLHTKQLLTLYRDITLFDDWISNYRLPKVDTERIWYLKQFNKCFGTNIQITDEIDKDTKRLYEFFSNRHTYGHTLKAILDTRENIPNKKTRQNNKTKKIAGKIYN